MVLDKFKVKRYIVPNDSEEAQIILSQFKKTCKPNHGVVIERVQNRKLW